MKKETFGAYILKSVYWYFGNLFFGCAPIIFLGFVYLASRGKLGFDDMQRQIHEGAILFVSVAMIGGVMVDFLQSEIKINGRQIIFIILAPVSLIGFLFLQYLFVLLKIINSDCLDVTSGSSVFELCFSTAYCISNKTNLLIKEDTKYGL
jgi:hypothetical protein